MKKNIENKNLSNKEMLTSRKYFFSFIKKNIKNTLFLIVSVVLASVSVLLSPIALKNIVDTLNTSIVNQQVDTKMIPLAILYFGSFFLTALCNFIENLAIDEFCHKFILDLRYKMMAKVYRLNEEYFVKNSKGDINSKIIDDVFAVEKSYTECLVLVVVAFARIVSIMITIFVSYWLLGIITLFIYIPLIFFVSNYVRKRVYKLQLSDRKNVNKQSAILYEVFKNHSVIHHLNVEEYEENKQFNNLLEEQKIISKTSVYDSVYSPIIKFLEATLIGIIALLVDLSISKNFLIESITVGTFSACVSLIGNLFGPIQDAGQELENLQEGKSGINKVIDFLNQEERVKQDDSIDVDKLASEKSSTYLSIKDMSFKYEGSDYLFDNMNLDIKEGEKILLKGRTGIGKTTLYKLIMGEYLPTSGSITFKGVNTYLVSDKQKAKLFGYVTPSFAFVDGTIRNQITLGKDTDLDINEILKECFLYNMINSLDKGLDTLFDENDFSNSQLQLLVLARVMYFNPKIILLDETNSSFDKETSDEFLKIFFDVCKNKTVIFISHIDEDEKRFDRVLEVKDKHIVLE